MRCDAGRQTAQPAAQNGNVDSPDTLARLFADLAAAGCDVAAYGDVTTVVAMRPFGRVPLSLRWRASRLHAQLVEFAAFTERADPLLIEASERLAAARPSSAFPLGDRMWDTADDLLTQAACDRDARGLVETLHNREAIALREMAGFRRLHDDDEGDEA